MSLRIREKKRVCCEMGRREKWWFALAAKATHDRVERTQERESLQQAFSVRGSGVLPAARLVGKSHKAYMLNAA